MIIQKPFIIYQYSDKIIRNFLISCYGFYFIFLELVASTLGENKSEERKTLFIIFYYYITY